MNKNIAALGLLLAIYSGFVFSSERIPGTQLTIDPPAGLEPATQFPGFLERDHGTALVATEIPGPISEISRGLSEANLASRGIEVISTTAVQLGEQDATLIHASQTAYDTAFLKWFLVFGTETRSFIVVGTYQKELDQQWSSIIRASLLSIRWDASIKRDLFEGLSFHISDGKYLKVAEKVGNALIMTTDGKITVKDDSLPSAIIASSFSDGETITDMTAHALQRLLTLKGYAELNVIRNDNTPITGVETRTILASATRVKSGREKFIYLVALYTNGAYYIFRGESELADRARYESEFASIINSFKLVQ